MTYCIKCSKPLTNDDIGFHRKMINRGDRKSTRLNSSHT